ncbi:hypothetical protein PR048_000421 [Dryococelus australis]|uniref:Uncharacterized protein n=1 Tax=Dryococelus australis TaxID=614101 RepID=A0ABQ9IEP1_9NEOP|nr:hypothetical protein PR048_000421 [Dryococelus australis]
MLAASVLLMCACAALAADDPSAEGSSRPGKRALTGVGFGYGVYATPSGLSHVTFSAARYSPNPAAGFPQQPWPGYLQQPYPSLYPSYYPYYYYPYGGYY